MNCVEKEVLKIAMEEAGRIFKEIKKKYAGLLGNLVFSSSIGQCTMSSDTLKILTEFPNMVCDSFRKQKALALIDSIHRAEMDKKSSAPHVKKKDLSQIIEKANRDLEPILGLLEMRDDTFIEIRFDGSSLDLIFELQKDPLVSKEYTPQTPASIRIVLGTVRELYEKSVSRYDSEWGGSLP
jgi:hypothetical protein